MSNKEQCILHKEQNSRVMTLGEERGCQIDGFDLGNSPEQILSKDLYNYSVAMITSNCTRGVIAAKRASSIYLAGFMNVAATANALLGGSYKDVLISPMGNLNGRCPADDACADYLRSYLLGEEVDYMQYRSSIVNSSEAKKFSNLETPEFPSRDLMICLSLNELPYELNVSNTDSITSVKAKLHNS